MVKKLAKPKPKQKPKQKQTQRQRQSVVVNVIQPKRTRVARATSRRGGLGGVGGGGAGGGNYVSGGNRPLYLNAPSETTPIVRNVELPPLMIKDEQQLSLPTTLKPSPFPAITYPMPTELQSSRESITPFIPPIQPTPPRAPSPPKQPPPTRIFGGTMNLMDELRQAQENRTVPDTMEDEIKKLKKSVARDINEAKRDELGQTRPPSALILKNRRERASRLATLLQG